MPTLGLDIGGANIKASDGLTRSLSRPFALWRNPEGLAAELASILQQFDDVDHLAVTMTGELADCFRTKAEGVSRILDAVDQAAGESIVQVWQTGGEFVSADFAREFPRLVAAANWHALACWAGRSVPQGRAMLIDIGSTTTDLIPIQDGLPATEGLTDVERLRHGELLYTGVRRTPVCAIDPSAFVSGIPLPVAAELFATSLDCWLLTGDLEESPDDHSTADGRPATREFAWNRLAHQFCGDVEEISLEMAEEAARHFAGIQRDRVAAAIRRIVDRSGGVEQIILSGEGEFLARMALAQIPGLADIPSLSLNELLGPTHSSAACAFALARLLESV
jgi:probable H4MPT-linked C1 transfer pathway protein